LDTAYCKRTSPSTNMPCNWWPARPGRHRLPRWLAAAGPTSLTGHPRSPHTGQGCGGTI
jgi:hypothetical protein